MNWNLEFAQIAKTFNMKFTNSLNNVNVYYQRLLMFAVFYNKCVYYYCLDV